MADLELQINDTHALLTIPIVDEDDVCVDLTNASSVTFVVRPEKDDESTKAMAVNTPVDSGTNATTAASTLTSAGQNFQTTVTIGDCLVVTTGNDIGSYIVTAINSDTVLQVAETFTGDTGQEYYVTDGSATVRPDAGMLKPGDQEVRVRITWVDTTVSYTVTYFIVKGLT